MAARTTHSALGGSLRRAVSTPVLSEGKSFSTIIQMRPLSMLSYAWRRRLPRPRMSPPRHFRVKFDRVIPQPVSSFTDSKESVLHCIRCLIVMLERISAHVSSEMLDFANVGKNAAQQFLRIVLKRHGSPRGRHFPACEAGVFPRRVDPRVRRAGLVSGSRHESRRAARF